MSVNGHTTVPSHSAFGDSPSMKMAMNGHSKVRPVPLSPEFVEATRSRVQHPLGQKDEHDVDLGTSTATTADGIPIIHTERRRDLRKTIVEEKTVTEREEKIVETLIKVPHKIYQTRVVERPCGKVIEEVVEVPKITTKQNFVEGPPQIEYKEVPRYKTREVNHVHEQVIYKEVEVPKYVEVPIEEVRYVPTPVPLVHQVPKLYESVTQYEVIVPKIVPIYKDIVVPLYVPRFVEACQVGESEKTAKQLQQFGLTTQDIEGADWTVETSQRLLQKALGANFQTFEGATTTSVNEKTVAGAKLVLKPTLPPSGSIRVKSPTPPSSQAPTQSPSTAKVTPRIPPTKTVAEDSKPSEAKSGMPKAGVTQPSVVKPSLPTTATPKSTKVEAKAPLSKAVGAPPKEEVAAEPVEEKEVSADKEVVAVPSAEKEVVEKERKEEAGALPSTSATLPQSTDDLSKDEASKSSAESDDGEKQS